MWIKGLAAAAVCLSITTTAHAAQSLTPDWAATYITIDPATVIPHTGKVAPGASVVTAPFAYNKVFKLTTPLVESRTGQAKAPAGTLGVRIGGMFDVDEPNNGSVYCLFVDNAYAVPLSYILTAKTGGEAPGIKPAKAVSVVSNLPQDFNEGRVVYNAPQVEHGAFAIPHVFALEFKVVKWTATSAEIALYSDGQLVGKTIYPREDGAVRLTYGGKTVVIRTDPQARAGSNASLVSVE